MKIVLNNSGGSRELSLAQKPCVATIGNFDGVHRGHETVIKTLLEAAAERSLPATVITFEPLAREFFTPEQACRLQPLSQRLDCLERLGIDQTLVIGFDQQLSNMSPESFVHEILVTGLGIKYLSVGDDFRFGHQRAGDFDYLSVQGKQHGFDVVAHETFLIGGARVSSGRAREAVQAGDFKLAATLLGRAYSISGRVCQGQQRGRTIGFPTANIVLDAPRFAVQGVYAVIAHLQDGRAAGGVANIGWRPTVSGTENRLEVHLFDFAADLYGQSLDVEFIAKIRDEQKFDTFEELTEQIKIDASTARAVLSTH